MFARGRGSLARVKRSLTQAPREIPERLGRPTIMDRALAARYGVPYVHLAAFAIDVDRVREEVESLTDERPFAWEVFLTACYVAWRFDPKDEAGLATLEDAVNGVLELRASEEGVFGTQLPFAVWILVERGLLPGACERWFRAWKKKPRELADALLPLFAEREERERELARFALSVALEPPLAPPTREALEALAGPPARA